MILKGEFEIIKLGGLGVFASTHLLDKKELALLANSAERLGFGSLWFPEATSYEFAEPSSGFDYTLPFIQITRSILDRIGVSFGQFQQVFVKID